MTAETKSASPGLRLAIDIGPLIVFFAVNFLTGGPKLGRVIAATAAFMVAIVIAMIVSQWKLGRISPMLWLSGVLVLVFGGLTLYFHDQLFIQLKPTIVYGMLAAVLAFGLATGRPLLKVMLESAYPGLSEVGWRKLTINWTLFFIAMAILNEVVRLSVDWDTWTLFKVWAVIPLTLVFAFANIPMLMKHGLSAESPPVPPEG